jgi:hypothetical protein
VTDAAFTQAKNLEAIWLWSTGAETVLLAERFGLANMVPKDPGSNR